MELIVSVTNTPACLTLPAVTNRQTERPALGQSFLLRFMQVDCVPSEGFFVKRELVTHRNIFLLLK